jgi:hypothetical protein
MVNGQISQESYHALCLPDRVIDTISISKDNEAYCTYVEEADDAANKVSQRPGAHPAGERIVNKSYPTGNYHLQGGNLQAKWYECLLY